MRLTKRVLAGILTIAAGERSVTAIANLRTGPVSAETAASQKGPLHRPPNSAEVKRASQKILPALRKAPQTKALLAKAVPDLDADVLSKALEYLINEGVVDEWMMDGGSEARYMATEALDKAIESIMSKTTITGRPLSELRRDLPEMSQETMVGVIAYLIEVRRLQYKEGGSGADPIVADVRRARIGG
jgi:hypothetical protein